MKATIEKQGAFSPPDTWCVRVSDGRTPVFDESRAVCEAVAEAINHPERWEPSEAYEVADQIRATHVRLPEGGKQ